MENLIGKRLSNSDSDGEPQTKHQKLDSVVTTTITDLNEQCLMHILSHLDVSTLLNVAMSNKKLQVAAAATFGREHGTKSIWLQNLININAPKLYTDDDHIYVCGLKFCLPFLRLFGAAAAELLVFDGTYPHVLVFNEYKSKFSHHIDRYLNEYCTENLSSLLFYGRPAFALENFRKPFRMMEKLCAIDANLENGLGHFTKWFPNLGHLEMHTVCIDDTFAPVTMPLLKHLTLKITDSDASEWNFSEEKAINFLQNNRLLRSLEIDMSNSRTISIQNLLDIIQRNRTIETLTMTEGSLCEDVTMDELERLVCEHYLLVEIDLPRHKFNVEHVIFCIHHLKSLSKLRFQLTGWSEYAQLIQLFADKWQLNQFHQTVQLILKTD